MKTLIKWFNEITAWVGVFGGAALFALAWWFRPDLLAHAWVGAWLITWLGEWWITDDEEQGLWCIGLLFLWWLVPIAMTGALFMEEDL